VSAAPDSGLPADIVSLDEPTPSGATPSGVRLWMRACRLRHWSKNALVFAAPLLCIQSASALAAPALMFVLLGLVASAGYLVNDLIDAPVDRAHPVKRFRPIAAGLIAPGIALRTACGLIAAALLASLALPPAATLALGAYVATTLAYSFGLKRFPILDVAILAWLFTLRVFAGGIFSLRPLSPWLLTVSMLFFLSLAVVKRYAELSRIARERPTDGAARGYTVRDLPILLTLGLASGLLAIGVFLIYVIDQHYPNGIYTHPMVLSLIAPIILVWMLRLWRLCVRGRMQEDPVAFALRDRLSLALGGAISMILIAARA
jgi:4-hydroxybenzoate polyprenyltransferase